MSKTRIASIDAMRLYGFLAILLLHIVYRPSDQITALGATDHLLRWAVPLYFLISGFLFDGGAKPVFVKWRQTAWRLASIFVFWEMIYLAVDHLTSGPSPNPTYLVHFLADTALNGGVAWHLWFLPSLGLCITIYCVLQKLPWRIILPMGCAVFFLCVALSPYAFLLGLPPLPTRPLFGLVFFMFGAYFAHRSHSISPRAAALLMMSGVAIQICEASVLSMYFAERFVPYDFLLGTFPFGIGAFALLKQLPVFKPAADLGRYAVGMYCVHVLWLWFAGGVLKLPAGPEATPFGLAATFAFVAAASIVTTLVLVKIPFLRRVAS